MEVTRLLAGEPEQIQKKVEEGKIMGIGIKHARLCFDLLDLTMLQALAVKKLSDLGRQPTEEEVEAAMTPCVQKEQMCAEKYSVDHILEVRAAFKLFVDFYDGKTASVLRN